jgi:hypothetical protein
MRFATNRAPKQVRPGVCDEACQDVTLPRANPRMRCGVAVQSTLVPIQAVLFDLTHSIPLLPGLWAHLDSQVRA